MVWEYRFGNYPGFINLEHKIVIFKSQLHCGELSYYIESGESFTNVTWIMQFKNPGPKNVLENIFKVLFVGVFDIII